MDKQSSLTNIDMTTLIISMKQEYSALCEHINLQHDNYKEFCFDDDELQTTLTPIIQDPKPYANGTIRTRPILKKYASHLCDKLDFETRIDACSEALLYEELTPKQMKTIIKQNTICEQLQEQVKKLTINKESLK